MDTLLSLTSSISELNICWGLLASQISSLCATPSPSDSSTSFPAHSGYYQKPFIANHFILWWSQDWQFLDQCLLV